MTHEMHDKLEVATKAYAKAIGKATEVPEHTAAEPKLEPAQEVKA